MTSNGHHVQQHNIYAGHYKPDASQYATTVPQHNPYLQNQQQDHQQTANPINAMQASNDIDSLLQIHRRKMIRRAANRRSAQQSRARKKALMGDLKIENLRLQKFADILDSQPELTFCIDKTGQITFMSDSASNFMKTTNADDNDDDPTHISQILTEESVGTVLDCVAQIRAEQCASQGLHGDHDGSGCISSVQTVSYHDASGYQVTGYIRCSRLIKRAPFDDTDSAAVVDNASGPSSKKCKTAISIPLTASNVAAASSSSGVFSLGTGVLQKYPLGSSPTPAPGLDVSSDFRPHVDPEEEFVCAIRPADASFPHSRDSQLFSSLLSTASIVAHDLELRSGSLSNTHQSYDLNCAPTTSLSYDSSINTHSHTQPFQPTSILNAQGACYHYQPFGSSKSHSGQTPSERRTSVAYLDEVGIAEDQPV